MSRARLACPQCAATPANLDMHLRFSCPVLEAKRAGVDVRPVGERRSPLREG